MPVYLFRIKLTHVVFICTISGIDQFAENGLFYLEKVADMLSTEDGSDLDVECQDRYKDEWKKQVMEGHV